MLGQGSAPSYLSQKLPDRQQQKNPMHAVSEMHLCIGRQSRVCMQQMQCQQPSGEATKCHLACCSPTVLSCTQHTCAVGQQRRGVEGGEGGHRGARGSGSRKGVGGKEDGFWEGGRQRRGAEGGWGFYQVLVALRRVRIVGGGWVVRHSACHSHGPALPCQPLTHKRWLECAFLQSTALWGC